MRFHEDGTRDFIDYGPAPENERDRGMPLRRIVSVYYTVIARSFDWNTGWGWRSIFRVDVLWM